MNEKYNVYLVSDSTGETLDRIFLSLKSQFKNFEYEKKEFAFVRTEQQIDKIINDNREKAIEYKQGKEKLFGLFVGQAMKASGGKANPQLINEILKKKL